MKAEWIINAAKEKIYAISHAKAVFRGSNGNTVDTDLTNLENGLSSHTGAQVNTETGAHNFRYYEDALQYYDGTNWLKISSSGDSNGYEDEMTVGVIADWANNTFTRTGMAAEIADNHGGRFEEFFEAFNRRRCIVADDGEILAFYGDDAYTETGKLEVEITKNGTTYAVGANAQVMVYQPKFYYKVTPISVVNNNYGGKTINSAKYQVSDVPLPGFKLHPNFFRNGLRLPYVLMAAYEACGQYSSGKYIAGSNHTTTLYYTSSVAGVIPIYKGRAAKTMQKIKNARGTGWDLHDIAALSCTQLLFTIEYATMDAQTAIGKGNVSSGSPIEAGLTKALGNSSGVDGTLEDGSNSVSYRGEENLWGNTAELLERILIDQSTYKVYTTKTTFTGMTAIDDTCIDTGLYWANDYSGYISRFSYSEEYDWMFVPAGTQGSSSQPVGDYSFKNAYITTTTMITILVGGYYSDKLRAGLFSKSTDDTAEGTGSYDRQGYRIMYIPS